VLPGVPPGKPQTISVPDAGAGNPIEHVGAGVLRTVMVWLTGRDMFPQASVALQVLLIAYPPHIPDVVVSTKLITGAWSQESRAIGAVNTGVAGQVIVALAPCPLRIGGL